MKSRISTCFIIVGLLIALLLGSCNGTPETTTTQPTTSMPPPTTPPTTTQPQELLTVHFIDVGQGDSILIDLDEIEVLIDGGDNSANIVPYLQQHVDGNLEVMVATHPHADHIGGLLDVLSTFQIEQIWHNGDSSTSVTYSNFMNFVQVEGAQVYIGKCGDQITAGELTFNIINPQNLSGSTNNNSLVMSLCYGEVDFLFTGDAEQEAESYMLVQSIVQLPEAEILKVGHHGSRTACCQTFLEITNPETAIYMAKVGNSYGHPHEETMLALSNIGADIYGTDVCGTILVTTDGIVYNVQTEKECDIETTPIATTTTPPPTTTQPPTTTTQVAINVQITFIFYDGIVPSVESDEYVEITNLGTSSVNLLGWRLVDIDEGYPELVFPSYILNPGQSVRVYTNEIHPEYGGFSFGSGKAVWNNSDPDTAVLYDDQGNEVSRRSY